MRACTLATGSMHFWNRSRHSSSKRAREIVEYRSLPAPHEHTTVYRMRAGRVMESYPHVHAAATTPAPEACSSTCMACRSTSSGSDTFGQAQPAKHGGPRTLKQVLELNGGGDAGAQRAFRALARRAQAAQRSRRAPQVHPGLALELLQDNSNTICTVMSGCSWLGKLVQQSRSAKAQPISTTAPGHPLRSILDAGVLRRGQPGARTKHDTS
jgi:hypothetical protein